MVNKRYHISRSCQNIDGFAFGIDKLHFICCSVIFEYRDDNSALMLVLPYLTAEYENNHQSFHEYYDEIEICQDAAGGHYKAAIQVRNREMVDRSDLVVCYIEHNSGGAFQTVQYAKKKNKEIVNLSDQ